MTNPISWLLVVAIVASALGLLMTTEISRGGGRFLLSVLLSITAIAAWGYWDWSRQLSVETPLLVYVFLAFVPTLAMAFQIRRLRLSGASARTQLAVGVVTAVLIALPAPLLAFGLLI